MSSVIHFFGDSLTAGYAVSSQENWVSLLQKKHPECICLNHGMCGALWDDMTDMITSFLIRREKNESFFLMGGTNDLLSGFRLCRMQETTERFIRNLSPRFPLTIGLPPPMTPFSITSGWQSADAYQKNITDLHQYILFLKKLCREQSISVIDFYTAVRHYTHYETTLYVDGIHCNAVGHSLFADRADVILFKDSAK